MIDKNPKVGRFVIKESTLIGGFFSVATAESRNIITKVSGKRIYFIMYGHPEYGESYIAQKSIAAVCDTVEEFNQLVDFEFRIRAERLELSKRHIQEFRALDINYEKL